MKKAIIITIVILLLCAGGYFLFKKKGNGEEPYVPHPETIIIYRHSGDILFTGDKIDLASKKITKYTKFKDYDNGEYQNIAASEVKDMTGVYSTNLSDVLVKNAYNVYVYLKHTTDENGVISKTELCYANDRGTFCKTYEGKYDESTGYWTDSKFEASKTELFNYFKWDEETSTSGYTKYDSCSIANSADYGEINGQLWDFAGCCGISGCMKLYSYGNAVSYAGDVSCRLEYGASYCEK